VFYPRSSTDPIGVISVLTVRMSRSDALHWTAAFDQIKEVLDNHSKSGKYSHLLFDNLNVPEEKSIPLSQIFALQFRSYKLLVYGESNVLIQASEEKRSHSSAGKLLNSVVKSPGCLIVRFQFDGVSEEASNLSSLITSNTPYNQLIDPEYNGEIRHLKLGSDYIPPFIDSSIESDDDLGIDSEQAKVVL